MQQLVSPNLTVQGKAGWCLSVQQDVWGTPHLYATAKDAWDAAQFKHTDLPPSDVYSICYWTYTENGTPYWHVATHAPDGRIYTSPFNVSYGSEWYASIDAMTARIRKIDPSSQYVGWVEDLSNVRLIKEQTVELINENSTNTLRIGHSEIGGWDVNKTHAGEYDATFHAAWDGHSVDEFIYAQWLGGAAFRAKRIEAIDYFDNKRPQVEQQVKDLTIQVAELTRALKIKNDLVDKLDAQVAMQSGDTQLLNGFGVLLSKIIVRLGLKG